MRVTLHFAIESLGLDYSENVGCIVARNPTLAQWGFVLLHNRKLWQSQRSEEAKIECTTNYDFKMIFSTKKYIPVRSSIFISMLYLLKQCNVTVILYWFYFE